MTLGEKWVLIFTFTDIPPGKKINKHELIVSIAQLTKEMFYCK
jgi:hypothetical protein